MRIFINFYHKSTSSFPQHFSLFSPLFDPHTTTTAQFTFYNCKLHFTTAQIVISCTLKYALVLHIRIKFTKIHYRPKQGLGRKGVGTVFPRKKQNRTRIRNHTKQNKSWGYDMRRNFESERKFAPGKAVRWWTARMHSWHSHGCHYKAAFCPPFQCDGNLFRIIAHNKCTNKDRKRLRGSQFESIRWFNTLYMPSLILLVF